MNKWIQIAILLAATLVASRLIGLGSRILDAKFRKRDHSLTGLAQVVKLLLWCGSVIVAIALAYGKSPVYVLSGMGAATAVLMLVFKDPIVGFVTGIQISQNDMVRVGDWIEVPGQEADGTVVDITLTTVKVRNWDNTMTMVPSYALVSSAFKNWRFMSLSGGRRIRRAIRIDQRTVRFLTDEDLARFRKINLVRDYVEERQREIEAANGDGASREESAANGRCQTNLGVFEEYLRRYLANRPEINEELTCMVRQLEPTELGLPLELYCFTKTRKWEEYERIQTDIFDHTIAVLPAFGLSVYQR